MASTPIEQVSCSLFALETEDKQTKSYRWTQKGNSVIRVCVLTNMENRLKQEPSAITLCGSW
jgi:hypothetical protein